MQKTDVTLVGAEDGFFDLNLLRFLRALVDTGSITRAGALLGMSQPASSRAMAKLRRHFGDPLLVRTEHGHVLTPLAHQAAPLVRQGLAATDAVFTVCHFDAAQTQRCFRVASTDYGLSTVLLGLLPRLQAQAPGLSVSADPWSDQTIAALERGELDCALYADSQLPRDFHYRPLFTDGYSVVCPAGHPLSAHRGATGLALLRAAAHHPQFAVRYPLRGQYATDNVYRTLGLPSPHIQFAAPYFHAVASAVRDGGLVAVVPARTARVWASGPDFNVILVRDKRLVFEYRLIWHARAHRDPGLVWLREQVVGEATSRSKPV